MSRRHEPRKAKLHRNYTVLEIVHIYDVRPQTVLSWIADGLAVANKKKPFLIRGADLKQYLKARIEKNRRPCPPGQIFCVACKWPQTPVGGSAQYEPVCSKSGNIVGTCPSCSRRIYRRISLANIHLAVGSLNVYFKEGFSNINGNSERSSYRQLEGQR